MRPEEFRVQLGVSRQRAYIIIGRKDFPNPWRELAMGKVWRSMDVEKWIRDHRPRSPSGSFSKHEMSPPLRDTPPRERQPARAAGSALEHVTAPRVSVDVSVLE
jgi:prophage regulatory protein